MTQRGSFKIASRGRAWEASLDPALRSAKRLERLLDSLCLEIQDAAHPSVEVRAVALVHAHHLGDDNDRQRKRDVRNQIDLTLCLRLVQQPVDDLDHP